VKMTGGMLDVDFENDGEKYSNIWLTGPADFVFRGQVEV